MRRSLTAVAIAIAVALPAALALAAGPTPKLKLLPATAVGRCAKPSNRTVILSATVTPVRSGPASSGQAWFAFGSSAAYTQGTARVRVPWVSRTAHVQSVTATIIPPPGTAHYAVLARGPRGVMTRTPDTILKAVPPPCPFPGGRRVSIPWILVGLDNAHRTATIRHDQPCGSSQPQIRITKHANNVVSIGVTLVLPEPAPECFAEPPPVTVKVKLPHAVSKAQLRHDKVTP